MIEVRFCRSYLLDRFNVGQFGNLGVLRVVEIYTRVFEGTRGNCFFCPFGCPSFPRQSEIGCDLGVVQCVHERPSLGIHLGLSKCNVTFQWYRWPAKLMINILVHYSLVSRELAWFALQLAWSQEGLCLPQPSGSHLLSTRIPRVNV